MKRQSTSSDITKLYTPTERALLARYLGIPDPSPSDLGEIDGSGPMDPETWNEAKAGIAPLESETGNNDLMIENAVRCRGNRRSDGAQMGDGGLARNKRARREPG